MSAPISSPPAPRDLNGRDQEAEEAHARWLADFDASIERGLADAEAGRGIDADLVFDALEPKYQAKVDATSES